MATTSMDSVPDLETSTMDPDIAILILDASLKQKALASTSSTSGVAVSAPVMPATRETPPTSPRVEGTPPVAAAAATPSSATTGMQTSLHLNEDDIVFILPPGGGRLT